jgi:ureidoglycolate amidohydrolase
MKVEVNQQRIAEELGTLASFSDTQAPAITRIVFSESDRKARAWIKGLFKEAGLEVREDAVGNTFARWFGSRRDLPVVGTGSHIDAIPNSGMFDGTVGVLGGLEAIRSLRESGFTPRRSIELVLFTSEEPTRFGIGCLGSRLLSGALTVEKAILLLDKNGISLDQARREAGFDGELNQVALRQDYFCSFIELHIEQGPRLEREDIPVGVVTSIAAPATIRVLVEGEGGHAGSVLMPERKDAFLAAAEITLAVETSVLATGAIDTVGTTGVCDIFPGAVNSIPSRVRLEIDVRDTDLGRRDNVLDNLSAAVKAIAARRHLEAQIETLNADWPAQSDERIVEALVRACDRLRKKSARVVSRAYHDSLFISRIAPVAMLFIPCRNGVSHRPDEHASLDNISTGVTVLAYALADLASQ